ncbi:hypothetical protein ACIO87_21415 [Streptomyces sp. NPDC087218]|uniref:hypothetical protein n=1 Tax=Streptomyces sp. NPDC087218 TaxID=3365769 RepID=UPI003823B276
MSSPTRTLAGTALAVGAAGCAATEYLNATAAGPAAPPRPCVAPAEGDPAARPEPRSRATSVTTAEVQR